MLLNIGGGSKHIPIPEHYAGWTHHLLDIDPRSKADIAIDARQLDTLESVRGAYSAVYCSHNLEHYFSHDVALVIRGMHHALKPDGFTEVRVPDVGAVMQTVAEKKLDLDDELYSSPSGPIRVRDVIWGYQREIERSNNDFYAHKTGFTVQSLENHFRTGGFAVAATASLPPFQILGYFFKQYPTPEQLALLQLRFS